MATDNRLEEARKRQVARQILFDAKRPFDLQTVLWDVDYLLSEIDRLNVEMKRANWVAFGATSEAKQ